MKALVYSDWETLEMREIAMPEPGSGEVRVKVEAAGICGSELEAFRKHSPRRKPPLILGHEFTGIIDAVGPDANRTVGEAIVSNAIISCGTCPACKRGMAHLCVNRQLFGMHRPGAFAEYLTVPVSTLIPRPAGVSPAEAAMAEPLGNAVHITGLLKDVKPQTSVVFGAGPIGLFTLQAIKHVFGGRVAVVDLSESRLELATKLGADFVGGPDSNIQEWVGETGIEVTIDAVGAEETKTASITWLRPGGTAVWIGLHENTSDFNAYDIILPEKKLLGSYACTQQELGLALNWIAEGKIDAKSWTSVIPLDQAKEGFETMVRPGPGDVKGVIVNR
ncbi:MAG TPA: alcohol dehydrogenase catalytic domain-containing protein [Fimbriimonadaceae bacterium]|jgi:L-iditol 2-dehydrogenase